MRMTRFQQYLLGGALVALAVLAGGWGFLHVTIQTGVEERSQLAQESFSRPGDDVGALIAYVQSEQHSLRERNQAVWALGQLRDPRAVPLLEAAYTGEPCSHDLFLCQRELGKALKLCRGETPNFLFIRTRRVQR